MSLSAALGQDRALSGFHVHGRERRQVASLGVEHQQVLVVLVHAPRLEIRRGIEGRDVVRADVPEHGPPAAGRGTMEIDRAVGCDRNAHARPERVIGNDRYHPVVLEDQRALARW